VAEVPDSAETLLVIAHNPGLEEWLQALCGARVRLSTAALAAVELDVARWADLDTEKGRLLWLITPRLVRALS